MIKYQKLCKVCKEIKTNKKLAERIYQSRAFNPSGKETMRAISNQHDFSYDSLKNHCSKHQFLSKNAADEKRINEMNKKVESEILEKVKHHTEVRELVLKEGYEGIEDGRIPLNASNVLTAARDQMNYESKVADRQLAMTEMIFHYASGSNADSKYDERTLDGQPRPGEEVIEGETLPVDDPTIPFAGNLNPGEERPSVVRRRTPGDEAPPRPEEVS